MTPARIIVAKARVSGTNARQNRSGDGRFHATARNGRSDGRFHTTAG